MKKYEILFLGIFIGMLIGSGINLIYTFIVVSLGCLSLCVIDFVKFIIEKNDIKAINLKLNQNKVV